MWGSSRSLREIRCYIKQTHASQHVLTFAIGPIARVGPNTLVTSSAELVMKMSAARSPYTKADWYAGSRIPPGQDNIFSQQDEEKHARRRAQMADGVRFRDRSSANFTDKFLVFRENQSVSRAHSRLARARPYWLASTEIHLNCRFL
jgi:hypothetical protein